MYSKYSIKDLGIGDTAPIKLRLHLNRNRKAQYGVIKKLTEILYEQANQKESINHVHKNHHRINKNDRIEPYNKRDSGKPVRNDKENKHRVS